MGYNGFQASCLDDSEGIKMYRKSNKTQSCISQYQTKGFTGKSWFPVATTVFQAKIVNGQEMRGLIKKNWTHLVGVELHTSHATRKDTSLPSAKMSAQKETQKQQKLFVAAAHHIQHKMAIKCPQLQCLEP